MKDLYKPVVIKKTFLVSTSILFLVFQIVNAQPMTYTVGTGGTYATLTGAGGVFQTMNSATITGNVTIQVLSNLTETGANSLTTFNDGGAGYTVTIIGSFSSAPSVPYVVSSTTVATATPMISIAIARLVHIDGRYSGSGNWLTFSNSNSTALNAGSTIQFSGGAVAGSYITNCNIVSNETTATSGAIVIGSGTNTVKIQNCNISDVTNGYVSGIYSNSATNVNDTITGNSFYQTTTSALSQTIINFTGGGGGHAIFGNYIGGKAASAGSAGWINTGAAAINVTGIYLSGSTSTSAPSEIWGNYVQYFAFTTNAFTGVSAVNLVNVGYNKAGVSQTGNTIGDPSSVKTIAFSSTVTGAVNGILVSNSVASNSYIGNNTIAGITASSIISSPIFAAINATLTGGNTVTTSIENNVVETLTIGGSADTKTFTGINVAASTNVVNIGDVTANTIGSSTAGNITKAGTSASSFTGISLVTTASGNLVNNNFVEGIKSVSAINFTGISLNVGSATPSTINSNTIQLINWTSASTSSFDGITVAGGLVYVGETNDGNFTSEGNTIGNASLLTSIAFGGTGAAYGIYNNAAATGSIISNNTIAGFTGLATGGSFTGIYLNGSTTYTTAAEIAANKIQYMSLTQTTGSFTGINSAAGLVNIGVISNGASVGSAAGNIIGGGSGTSITFTAATTAAITGITVATASITGCQVANNTISYIKNSNTATTESFTGISMSGSPGATVAHSIQSNTIDNVTLTASSTSSLYGIYGTVNAGLTIGGSGAGNTIGGTAGNMTNTGTGTTEGIYVVPASAGLYVYNISNNSITGFTTASTAVNVAGIYLLNAGAATGTVNNFNNNSINTFTTSGAAPVLYGMYIGLNNSATVNSLIQGNNINTISLNGTTGAAVFTGIDVPSGVVTIGGASALGNTIGSATLGNITNAGSFQCTENGIILVSASTTNGSIITNNTIEGIQATTVTNDAGAFIGISASVASTTAASEVTGNTIQTISLVAAATFQGIVAPGVGLLYIGTKSDGSFAALGNTIGSLSSLTNIQTPTNSSYPVYGINYTGTTTASGSIISNNNIYGFTLSGSAPFTGINFSGSYSYTGSAQEIAGNTIQYISMTGANTGFTGISVLNGWTYIGVRRDGVTAAGNTIGGSYAKEISVGTTTGATASSGSIVGITFTTSSTANCLVSNNIISFLRSYSSTSTQTFSGIDISGAAGSGTDLVQSNILSNDTLFSASSGAFYGIYANSARNITIGGSNAAENYIGSALAGNMFNNGTSTTMGICRTTFSGYTDIISNNSVKGFTCACTGTTPATCVNGIYVSSTSATNINVNYNSVSNFTVPGSATEFNGIYASLSSGNTFEGDTIQAITVSGTAGSLFYGMQFAGTTGGTVGGSAAANHNVIGGSGANAISYSGTAAAYGIFNNAVTTNPLNITYSNISNISSATASATATVYGIYSTSTQVQNISNNNVNTLSVNSTYNTSGVGAVSTFSAAGIIAPALGTHSILNQDTVSAISCANNGAYLTNAVGIADMCGVINAANTISQCAVYNVTNASTGSNPSANGIYIYNTTANSVYLYNNMVMLGYNQTTNTAFNGIWLNDANLANGQYDSIYFNTVDIEGSPVTNTVPTYAFLLGTNNSNPGTSPQPLFFNNIFSNIRGTSSGTTDFAIAVNGPGYEANFYGGINASSNYNDLYSISPATLGQWDGVSKTFGSGAGGWSVAQSTGSGCDLYSFNIQPSFVSGYTSNGILDLSTPGSCELKGQALPKTGVTIDFHSATRSVLYPTIGADELNSSASAVSGLIPVGSSHSYPWNTLTNAIDYLYCVGINGPVTLSLDNASGTYTQASEVFPIVIKPISGTSSTNTVTISPAAGLAETVSNNNDTGLFQFSESSWVIFNGNNGTTNRQLTLTNTYTLNTSPLFIFRNDAQHDVIQNCNITGGNSTKTAGGECGIIYFGNGYTSGNSFNKINNCSIGATGSTDTTSYGIYSYNSTGGGVLNATDTIEYSDIYNWGIGGIYLASTGNGSAWNIMADTMYYNLNSGVATTSQTAINIQTPTSIGGFMIDSNYIGGQSSVPGGSAWGNSYGGNFSGIIIPTHSLTNISEINGNTIQNISLTGGGFVGINVTGLINIGYTSTNLATVGNTIGGSYAINVAPVTSGSSGITGIALTSGSTTNTFIANNTISNITGNANATGTFYGINAIYSGGASQVASIEGNSLKNITIAAAGNISGNGFNGINANGNNIIRVGDLVPDTIGSSVANNISLGSGVGPSAVGISVSTTGSTNIINGNFVQGFNIAAAQFSGIYLSSGSGGAAAITSNKIQSLNITSAAFYGITAAAGVIYVGETNDGNFTPEGNTIGSLSSLSNISFSGSGNLWPIYYPSQAIGGVISYNTIGGFTASGTGNFIGIGVNFSGTYSAVSEIVANTIQYLSFTGACSGFTGINVGQGWVNVGVKRDNITQAGNTIGDTAGVKTISFTGNLNGPVAGITITSATTGNSYLSNNIVAGISSVYTGGISSFVGISGGSSGGTTSQYTYVENNVVSGISLASTNFGTFTGITISSVNTVAFGDVASNRVGANSTSPYSITYAGSGNIMPIYVSPGGGGPNIVANNYVEGIQMTGAGNFYGIAFGTVGSSPAMLVQSNTIREIDQTYTGATTSNIYGIFSGFNSTNGGSFTIGGTSGLGNNINTINCSGTGTNNVAGICIIPPVASNYAYNISYNSIKGISSATTGTTAATAIEGIYLSNSQAQGANINYNNISGISTATNAAAPLAGIYLSVSATTPATIKGDTIEGITMSGTTGATKFYGIELAGNTSANIGANGAGNYNLIGTAASPISYSGTSSAYGIYNTATGAVNMAYNEINNITSYTSGVGTSVYGIYSTGTGVQSIADNNINTLSVNNAYATSGVTNAASFAAAGIVATALGAKSVIGSDTVYGISCTNPTANYANAVGIALIGGTTDTIRQCDIYNINNASSGTLPSATGIYIYAPTTSVVVYDNMVMLGYNQTTNTNFNGIWLNSISNAAPTAFIYYNTVDIEGSPATNTLSTYAFLRSTNITATSNPTIIDNLLSNIRGGGTGNHFAIASNGGLYGTNWTAANINYNDLWSTNPATLGQWNSASTTFGNASGGWSAAQTAGSGGDANSINVQPAFVSNYTTTGILDLTTGNCGIAGEGKPVTLTSFDFHNAVRNATNPTIGADEIPYPAGSPISISSATNASVCGGSSGSMSVTMSGGSSFSYSWQYDSSGVYIPVSNGTPTGFTYTNTSAASIRVTTLGSATPGSYFYRCYVTNTGSGCNVTLPGYSVDTFTVAICSSTWNGVADTNWFNATNWSPAVVPNNCAADVIIPSGTPFHPVVSGSAVSVGNINISQGAILALQGENMNVCGTWTGGTSSNALVTGSGAVFINSSSSAQTINGNTQFSILQIDNSNGVTLSSGAVAAISTGLHLQSGTFSIGAGTLHLLSTASNNNSYIDDFTAGFTGKLSGATAIIDRYVPVRGFNQHFISSPISSPSFSQLGANGPDGSYVLPSSNCNEYQSANGTPYGAVFQYNDGHEASGGCMLANWEVRSAGTLDNARGYSTYLTGNTTLSVNGTVNTGYIKSANLNNSGYPTVNTLQGQPIESGWNLVGNPYPSAIDLTIPRDTNGFQAQVQVWQTTGPFAGSWKTKMITGESGQVVIPPFQAFMVRIDSLSTGTHYYPFYESERVRVTDSAFYRTQAQNTLQLTLNYNGVQDQTIVSFNPSATFAFDNDYDANKPDGGQGRPTLYTTMNDNHWYGINTLPLLTTATTVPLGLHPEVSGSMSVTPSGIESFDATTYIYLEDKTTGAWTNLRNGAYTFNTNATDAQDRFVLHFTPPAEILTRSSDCNTTGLITISQPGTASWSYVITNANNVPVATGTLNQANQVIIDANAGVYTLTLTDSSGYTVVKNIQVGGTDAVVASFTSSANTAQASQNVSFTSTTVNNDGATYSWNFGDGTTATGPSVTHDYSQPGTYTAELTVTNASGCVSTTTRVIVITQRSTTGVSNLNNNGKINIWSNEDRIYVDFSSQTTVDARIDIYNVLGQLLSSEKFGKANLYSKEIDNLEAAYMIVKVTNNDLTTTGKVFIANVNK